MTKFKNIVATQIGRGNDPTGHGYYGADRSNKTRKHKGFDIITTPGEKVFAPHAGKIRVGVVYPTTKPNKPTMRLVEVTEPTYRNKLSYVKPLVNNGEFVEAGQVIGIAQNITDYHTEGPKDPDAKMINHIHVSVYKNGLLTDPEPLFHIDFKKK